MAPRTRKRKSPPEEQHEARPTTKPQASRGKKGGDMKEYAPDEGRNGSRQFLNGTSSSKKRRTLLKDGQRELRKRAEDMAAFIDSQASQSSLTSDAASVANNLLSDPAAVLPYCKATSGASQSPSRGSEVYKKALQRLEDFHKSVRDYEKLNKRDTKIKRPERARWEQDVRDLRELDSEALKISVRIVTNLIMPVPGPPLAKPETDNMERVAWEVLEAGVADSPGQSWGVMAQELVRGFASLLRPVPGAG